MNEKFHFNFETTSTNIYAANIFANSDINKLKMRLTERTLNAAPRQHHLLECMSRHKRKVQNIDEAFNPNCIKNAAARLANSNRLLAKQYSEIL